MRTSIQLRGEEQVGDRIYAVEVRADADESVVVDLVGALPDGTVVAEGGLVLPGTDLMTAGQLLERTLRGLAVVQDAGKPAAKPKARTPPANAGRPWTPDQDAGLRRQWTEGAVGLPALAEQYGRSKWAIRARLIHLGCDPARAEPDAANEAEVATKSN
ncbi:MAG: hypothetical protein JOZ47_22430 [Kutzneria sp.]|nr:hypothetical protein [Kutzneria sp.]